MIEANPFNDYLVENWRMRLFSDEIFPGFPFRPSRWTAMAFDRDSQGGIRIPEAVWTCLVNTLRNSTKERFAFVASSHPLRGGVVAERQQPFVVALDPSSVIAHFNDRTSYLPEFFMAGGSETWAIWGDSDITVIGGDPEIMSLVTSSIGSPEALVEFIARDFRLKQNAEDAEMWTYIRRLVARPE